MTFDAVVVFGLVSQLFFKSCSSYCAIMYECGKVKKTWAIKLGYRVILEQCVLMLTIILELFTIILKEIVENYCKWKSC